MRYIKITKLVFPKKILFRQFGHFWPQNVGHHNSRSTLTNFFKILSDEMGEEVLENHIKFFRNSSSGKMHHFWIPNK